MCEKCVSVHAHLFASRVSVHAHLFAYHVGTGRGRGRAKVGQKYTYTCTGRATAGQKHAHKCIFTLPQRKKLTLSLSIPLSHTHPSPLHPSLLCLPSASSSHPLHYLPSPLIFGKGSFLGKFHIFCFSECCHHLDSHFDVTMDEDGGGARRGSAEVEGGCEV